MNWKIILLAISVYFLLTWQLARQAKQIRELTTNNKQLVAFADQDSARAEIYLNNWHRETSRSKVLELSERNLKDLAATRELAWLQQFAGLRKDLRNLDAAVKLTATVTQSLKLSTRDTTIFLPISDSARSGADSVLRVSARAFAYADRFNELRGFIAGDTTYIDTLSIEVPIEGVVYAGKRSKKFLFFRYGPRPYYGEFTSANPWVRIPQQTVIKMKPAK